ncbi:hypothetical protein CASFOL_024699 [Castilleja foliolosa]|uniref:Uncharacterized protein n=1 Tax=Castilleja foliolosa TaxID=1961234 RepID=A0ABD3CP34_9LAMI
MTTTSSFLLQSPTLNWKNHLHHSPQFPTRPSNAKFRITIDIKRKFGFDVNIESKQNPFEFGAKSIVNALKALQKPAAAALIVGLLLIYDSNSALAAGSGGRMGGSSFSSRSSSSSSRSYSAPSSEAKSSSSYSAPKSEPSWSSSSLWSSESEPSWSSSSLWSSESSSARSYSVPKVESGFSYSVYEPSQLGGVSGSPAADVESGAFLILIAFVAFVLVSRLMSEGSKSSNVLTDDKKTSVLKVQVGLLGLGRSLQKDLNRIAETADTSTSEGLHYILTETVLALLRHPDYCISTYSSIDIKRGMDEGEKRFNQLSIEERGKFDEETLVNVNNIKKQSSTNLRGSGFSNEYIVVTMLVAAVGVQKLPSINNSKDLKEALQKLASIPSSRILAVEVLWTPQNEDDTLSERELLEDYPLLRPL